MSNTTANPATHNAKNTASNTPTKSISDKGTPIRGKKTSRSSKRPQRRGVNPWIPNQHGAWAMLLVPLILGIIMGLALAPQLHLRTTLTLFMVAATWLIGYFTFFAFELWFKAKNPRRKAHYARPMMVYGSMTAVLGIIVLVLNWKLVWWAIPFAPLVTWACVEIYRHHPRSLSSGLSTTLASSLMIPVLVSTTTSPLPAFLSTAPEEVGLFTLAVALYFTTTIPYVKTLIRERGNKQFWAFSMTAHVVALVIASMATLRVMAHGGFMISGILIIATFLWCAYRSWKIPHLAQLNPQVWTPKRVGMLEMLPSKVLSIAAILWLVL